jgi:3-oxoadipate enol-lactonase
MPVSSHENINIFYTEKGKNFPLVLLSGLGGDHQSVWGPCIDVFSNHYRTITLDNRNCGKSSFVDTPFTIRDMANDLKALMQHLNIKKFHLAGFSMGGLIAQQYAQLYPDDISHLVLASTYSVMEPYIRLYLDAVENAYLQTQSLQTIFELVYPFLFHPNFYTGKSQLLKLPSEELKEPLCGWLRQYEAQRHFNSQSWLSNIQHPTLVIGGDKDLLVPFSAFKFLSDNIPKAKLVIIKNAGHMVSIEQMEAFTHSTIEFFRSG